MTVVMMQQEQVSIAKRTLSVQSALLRWSARVSHTAISTDPSILTLSANGAAQFLYGSVTETLTIVTHATGSQVVTNQQIVLDRKAVHSRLPIHQLVQSLP